MQVITKMESQGFQLPHQRRVTTRGYLVFGGKTCLLRKILKRVTKLFCLLPLFQLFISFMASDHGYCARRKNPDPRKTQQSPQVCTFTCLQCSWGWLFHKFSPSRAGNEPNLVLHARHVQILKNNPALLTWWPVAAKSSHLSWCFYKETWMVDHQALGGGPLLAPHEAPVSWKNLNWRLKGIRD